MKVTLTCKGCTLNLDTEAGTITGQTYGLRNMIKEDFPGVCWDAATKAWTMEPEAMETRLEKMNNYFVRVYNMKIAQPVTEETAAKETAKETAQQATKTEQATTTTAKTVVRSELVNRWDGFYYITHYSDGTKSEQFCG